MPNLLKTLPKVQSDIIYNNLIQVYINTPINTPKQGMLFCTPYKNNVVISSIARIAQKWKFVNSKLRE